MTRVSRKNRRRAKREGDSEQKNGDGDNGDHNATAHAQPGHGENQPLKEIKETDARDQHKGRYEYWTLILNAAVAVAALVALYFVAEQLAAMKVQSRIMADQLTAMRESAHLDQRAWIAFDGIDGAPTVNEGLTITVRLHNSGKTPALKVQSLITSRIGRVRGIQPPIDYDKGETIGTRSQGLLTPGQPYAQTHIFRDMNDPKRPPYKFTKDDIAAIASGEIGLFAYGRLTYDDAFQCSRWITYCWAYSGSKKTWTACQKGNEMDDSARCKSERR